MVSKTVKFKSRPPVLTNDEDKTTMLLEDFFKIHDSFINFKVLEGLTPRTLEDHKYFMKFFKDYVVSSCWSMEDQQVEINIFRGYIADMITVKEYAPCTINLRIRPLKCYLKWLYDEGYISINYSNKIKLVRVPQDTIQPLSDKNVKKLLKQPNKETYAGYRDFVLMLLILDCGIRIGEALQLKINDIDYKLGLVNIQSEVSKTRTFRQIPISNKVAKLLEDLRTISIDNNSEYLFLSTYGGPIKPDNIAYNFRKYGRDAKIDAKCTPYVLRHTFATNAVKENMDIFTLQRIMGHSALETTRKYIQLNNKDLKNNHNQKDFISKYL